MMASLIQKLHYFSFHCNDLTNCLIQCDLWLWTSLGGALPWMFLSFCLDFTDQGHFTDGAPSPPKCKTLCLIELCRPLITCSFRDRLISSCLHKSWVFWSIYFILLVTAATVCLKCFSWVCFYCIFLFIVSYVKSTSWHIVGIYSFKKIMLLLLNEKNSHLLNFRISTVI